MSGALAGGRLDVAEGEDGWLFLASYGDFAVLRLQADLSIWAQSFLPALTAQFVKRHARLAARGIPYVVAIAPEKTIIYSEKLPPGYGVASPSAAQLLTSSCVQAGITAVDLTSLLRLAKGALDLYYRTDTHWTYFGAYLAYLAIIGQVQKTFPVSDIKPEQVSYYETDGFGDLGVHMKPERRGKMQRAKLTTPDAVTLIDTYDERERAFTSHYCQQGHGRALIVRDSFATFLAPFLSRSFAETHYASPPSALLDDMIEDLKPDVVIHECSERALLIPPEELADWDPRSWHQIYFEAHTHPQLGGLIRPLRQALREGRYENAIELGRQISESVPGALDHNLAEAFLLAGAYEDVLETCRCAETVHGGNPYVYYLKAVAQHGLGRRDEALRSLSEALKARPHHGRFLFLQQAWFAMEGATPAPGGS